MLYWLAYNLAFYLHTEEFSNTIEVMDNGLGYATPRILRAYLVIVDGVDSRQHEPDVFVTIPFIQLARSNDYLGETAL